MNTKKVKNPAKSLSPSQFTKEMTSLDRLFDQSKPRRLSKNSPRKPGEETNFVPHL
jgi:hypothetical protein